MKDLKIERNPPTENGVILLRLTGALDAHTFDDLDSIFEDLFAEDHYKLVLDMEGVQLDGNDIKAVHRTVSQAAARARSGDGPTLIELKTQRFNGHSSGDPQVYRTKSSVEELRRTRDPNTRLETELVSAGLLGNRDALMAEIEAEVAQAVQFAESSPYPADEELSRDVYAESR